MLDACKIIPIAFGDNAITASSVGLRRAVCEDEESVVGSHQVLKAKANQACFLSENGSEVDFKNCLSGLQTGEMTADEAFAWLKEVASTSEEVKCLSAWYQCQVMALRKQFDMMPMMAVVEQAVVSDVDSPEVVASLLTTTMQEMLTDVSGNQHVPVSPRCDSARKGDSNGVDRSGVDCEKLFRSTDIKFSVTEAVPFQNRRSSRWTRSLS